MGEMRDSDWSTKFLLRSDWLLPIVALITTRMHETMFADQWFMLDAF